MTLSQGHEWTAANSRAFLEEFELGPWSSGPLSGLSVAISDGIDIEERVTGCGNAAWREGRVIAAKNAAAVDLLLASGAQCRGKTRITEFGFTLLGESEAASRPLNGKFPERLVGGSATGIASAVSCGIVDFGLGIDTGGTALAPAANCGLTGWRCSHGVVSGAGLLPVAPSFDCPAIICQDPAILDSVCECLLACDPVKDTSPEIFVLTDAIKLLDQSARAGFERSLVKLRELAGTSIEQTSMEAICDSPGASLDDCFGVFEQLLGMEVWNSLGGWVENCMPQMGDEAKQRLFTARHLDRSQLPSLARRRYFYSERLSGFLGRKRILCLPTTPYAAPNLGFLSKSSEAGRYLKLVMTLAAISSMGGAPQVTLPPEPGADGPGLSLISSKGNDAFLVGFARRWR